MDYEVLLNGKKIDNSIIKDTQVTDRYGAQSDDIKIVLLNNTSIEVQKGYTLECSFGGFRSGKMNVDRIPSSTTSSVLGAISAPICAKEPKTRQWNKVRLFDIVNDIAVNCGISVYYQGVENHLYESVTQFRENDLAFLNRLCIREGYSLKIDDNRLIIYKNSVVEALPSVGTIGFNDVISNRIVFAENPNTVRSVTAKYFADRLISYTAIKGNLGEGRVITEYLANNAEAERFAKGYLETYTQNNFTVDALIPINDGIAAGSNLDFEGFSRYDGKYFITECCHNPDKDQTRVIGRRIV